jgi:phospholipase/lecithinase/hemolysin
MKRITGSLVLAVLLLMAPALAGAASFRALYVFGDSLSDAGNAAALSGDLFPPAFLGYAHRFSNGPVAAEYLAALMGVPGEPSSSGGTNFAVGGATTGTENFNFVVQQPFPLPDSFEVSGIEAQVGDALAGPAFNPARTLVLVWGGPNDIFLALATNPGELPATIVQAVTNLAGDVGALARAGARYVLVPNMPDLGETPFGTSQGPAGQAFLTQVTQAFNTALASAMSDLEHRLGGWVRIDVFDTFAVQRQIMRRPHLFGFTDTTSFCLAHPAALPDCRGFVFFDDVHPTTAAHRVLGVFLAASCVRFGKSCFHGVGRDLD